MNIIPQRQCTRCKSFFPATTEHFNQRKDVPCGLTSHCKSCIREAYLIRRGPIEIVPDGFKRCSVCKQCKSATPEFFERSKVGVYGVVSTCRECRKTKAEENLKLEGQMRQCSKCLQDKPATLEFFHRRMSRDSGLSSWCRACVLTYKRDNKEKNQQYNLLYRQNHKAASRDYYQVHWHEHKEYRQQRYQSKREELLDRARLYRLAHTEQISINKRRYHQEHREESKARRRLHRARAKQVGGVFTAQDEHKQYERQKGRCYYCHKKVKKGEYHLDHVIPLTREGSFNGPDNIVIACAICNMHKHNRFPHEWPEGGRLM